MKNSIDSIKNKMESGIIQFQLDVQFAFLHPNHSSLITSMSAIANNIMA